MKKIKLFVFFFFVWILNSGFIKGYPTTEEQKNLISTNKIYVGMDRKDFYKVHGNFASFWTKGKEFEIIFNSRDLNKLKYLFLFKDKKILSIHDKDDVFENWIDLKKAIYINGGPKTFTGSLWMGKSEKFVNVLNDGEKIFLETKKYKAKLKKENEKKQRALNKILATKKENEYKLLISNLEKKFNSQCETGIFNPKGFKKGSEDYNECLMSKHNAEKQKIIDQKEEERKKRIAESNRIKKEMALLKQMNPEERSIYKCENTFGYKKGSTKYKECVFELYKTEIEFEKLKLQKANEKQRLELEREKVNAANAQAEAAREQAEAARRNAEANERSANTAANERSRKMMQRGVRSLHDNCILKGTC